jgi:hypothetical protein
MMPDEINRAEPPQPEPYYAYKPSLMGSPWEFWLKPYGLGWRVGRTEGETPYADITSVRLAYRPITMQTHRFVAEIRSRNGPRLTLSSSSWRSLVEQGSQLEAYSAFVRDLHRRLAEAGSRAEFHTGLPPALYWPGVLAFAAVSLATLGLAVRALVVGEWAAAALIGGFFALFAWQSGGFFDRNRPGHYLPQAPPDKLVPPK